jgi:hypothetical protein
MTISGSLIGYATHRSLIEWSLHDFPANDAQLGLAAGPKFTFLKPGYRRPVT